MNNDKIVLGVDFGGSGIKGAPVNIKTGELLEKRYRLETPAKATPSAVAKVVKEIVEKFKWQGMLGIGFPAVVRQGIVYTAANIDKAWIGTNTIKLFNEATRCDSLVLNDADAAGIAEMKYGAGQKKKGLVFLVTVGTGIGTAIFVKRKLVPNTELGHVYLPNGKEAEAYTSDAARKKENLSWDVWAMRFNEYLTYIEGLFWPELIIIGGGVSKKMDKFARHITIKTSYCAARMLNEAGIAGAAVAAYKAKKLALK